MAKKQPDFDWLMSGIQLKYGKAGANKVLAATKQAVDAGVPWPAIIAVVVSLLMSAINGGGIDLQKIIDAILALIPAK